MCACKHTHALTLTVVQRGHCSVGWGGRRRPPKGHRNQRTELECAAHPTAPITTHTHTHRCESYHHVPLKSAAFRSSQFKSFFPQLQSCSHFWKMTNSTQYFAAALLSSISETPWVHAIYNWTPPVFYYSYNQEDDHEYKFSLKLWGEEKGLHSHLLPLLCFVL